jgi:hypothetical protein
MTIKIKEITTYNFEDLSEEAKENAIEKERDYKHSFYSELHDNVDFYEHELKEFGLIEPEIIYSGFSSQGDGLSFTATRIDIEDFCKKTKTKARFKTLVKYQEFISSEIKRINYHYSHENTVESYFCYEGSSYHSIRTQNAIEKQIGEFEEYFENWRIEKCREFYKALGDDYDFQFSDEYLIEDIENRECKFDIEGNRF